MKSSVQNNLQQEFNIKSGGDNKNKVEKLYDKFKEASINENNLEQYYASFENVSTVLGSQIENLLFGYMSKKEVFNKLLDEPKTKKAAQNDVVPLELFNTLKEAHNHAKEMLGWRNLENEILLKFLEALFIYAKDLKQMQLTRDVYRETKGMIERQNEAYISNQSRIMNNFQDSLTLLFRKWISSQKEVLMAHKGQSQEERQAFLLALKELGEKVGFEVSLPRTNAQVDALSKKSFLENDLQKAVPQLFEEITPVPTSSPKVVVQEEEGSEEFSDPFAEEKEEEPSQKNVVPSFIKEEQPAKKEEKETKDQDKSVSSDEDYVNPLEDL